LHSCCPGYGWGKGVIVERGELRIGLEVGYMPFEMIDKRSGLRQKEIRHGGLRRKGRQLSLMGFDIDMGIEMGMSVTEERKKLVDFANPFMIVGQTVLLNAKHTDTVHSYKDLNDPKFIVVSKPGTTGEEAVQRLIPKATYESANTENEGAMRVLEGTADAFVYDFPFNAVFSAMNPSNKLVFLSV